MRRALACVAVAEQTRLVLVQDIVAPSVLNFVVSTATNRHRPFAVLIETLQPYFEEDTVRALHARTRVFLRMPNYGCKLFFVMACLGKYTCCFLQLVGSSFSPTVASSERFGRQVVRPAGLIDWLVMVSLSMILVVGMT